MDYIISKIDEKLQRILARRKYGYASLYSRIKIEYVLTLIFIPISGIKILRESALISEKKSYPLSKSRL